MNKTKLTSLLWCLITLSTANAAAPVTLHHNGQVQHYIETSDTQLLLSKIALQVTKGTDSSLEIQQYLTDKQHSTGKLLTKDSVNWPSTDKIVAATRCNLTSKEQFDLVVLSQANNQDKLQLSAIPFDQKFALKPIPLAAISIDRKFANVMLKCLSLDGNPWRDIAIFNVDKNQLSGQLVANISPNLSRYQLRSLPRVTLTKATPENQWLGVTLDNRQLKLWSATAADIPAQIFAIIDSADIFGRTQVSQEELANSGDVTTKLSYAAVKSLMAVNITSYYQLLKYLNIKKNALPQYTPKLLAKHKQSLANLHPAMAPKVIDQVIEKLSTP